MVYRGRPSTGCERCRKRKIKCDERPGGCTKCLDKHLPCPGYDRTIDAFFHDETAKVSARAQRTKAKALALREAQDAECISFTLTTSSVASPSPAPMPSVMIMPSLIDQGINFFMSNCALGLDQPPVRSAAYHEHLTTYGFHPLVATSMTALGIAGVANIHGDVGLKREAMKWYLNAIKMANAALSSPKDVRGDATLVAISLLSIFEATTNEHSLEGWSQHVEGAATIVKMRGAAQFATPTGRRMYLHTVGLLTICCIGRGEPMPPYVAELNEQIKKFLDLDDPRNAFFFLHIRLNDLRAEVLSGRTLDLRDIISRAKELDAVAEVIFDDAGPEWAYDEVRSSHDPSGVFQGYYHVYATHAAAQTWNWVRYNRIYFHDMIRNAILTGFAATPPALMDREYFDQLAKSTEVLRKLQGDILASMPQFLHDVPMGPPFAQDAASPLDPRSVAIHDSAIADLAKQSPSLFSSPTSASPRRAPSTVSTGPTPNSSVRKLFHANFRDHTSPMSALAASPALHNAPPERLPILHISGGYSTLWALYVAGAMPTASKESQEYVLTTLGRVESEFGIMQARIMGCALRFKRRGRERTGSGGRRELRVCERYLPDDWEWQEARREEYEGG